MEWHSLPIPLPDENPPMHWKTFTSWKYILIKFYQEGNLFFFRKLLFRQCLWVASIVNSQLCAYSLVPSCFVGEIWMLVEKQYYILNYYKDYLNNNLKSFLLLSLALIQVEEALFELRLVIFLLCSFCVGILGDYPLTHCWNVFIWVWHVDSDILHLNLLGRIGENQILYLSKSHSYAHIVNLSNSESDEGLTNKGPYS